MPKLRVTLVLDDDSEGSSFTLEDYVMKREVRSVTTNNTTTTFTTNKITIEGEQAGGNEPQ